MDQITAIEDAIIALLNDLLRAPGLSAAALPFPDKDFETYEPMHGNGEILVAYVSEDAGAPEALDIVVQEREMYFELTFVFSSLRTVGRVGGLYAHLEATRMTLTGCKPEGCCKKTLLAGVDRVKRYKKRWWQYTQTFKFTALNIESVAEGLGILLNRITINTGDRSTDVTT